MTKRSSCRCSPAARPANTGGRGVLEYARRHGYRGPEGFVELPERAAAEDYEEALAEYPDSDDLLAAVVLAADETRLSAALRGGETLTVSGEALRFAARALDRKAAPARPIRRGALVRGERGARSQTWRGH